MQPAKSRRRKLVRNDYLQNELSPFLFLDGRTDVRRSIYIQCVSWDSPNYIPRAVSKFSNLKPYLRLFQVNETKLGEAKETHST